MRSLGITSGLSCHLPAAAGLAARSRRARRRCPRCRANARPGLGSQRTISACACAQQVLVGAGGAVSRLTSRRASSSRCWRQISSAIGLRRAARGQRAQLQRQALGQERAPTPSGSRLCSQLQRALQPVEQFLALLRRRRRRPAGQALGDLFQRVGQVAVVVERLDQDRQRARGPPASAACRPVWRAQVILQRLCRAPRSRRRRRRRRRRCCRRCAGISRMPSKSSRSVPFSQSSRSVVPNSRAVDFGRPALASAPFATPLSAVRRALARAARAVARLAGRSALLAGCGVERALQPSSPLRGRGSASSICSTSCCSSSVDSCSRRIDCCSCGVSARCCDRRTCRDGFMPDAYGGRVPTCGSVRRGRPCARRRCRRSARRALGQHAAVADDVGVVADAQRLAHVVVGDQHADAARLEEADDALDLDHRDRVDAGERLVEQDEARLRGQRARDLDAPPLAARQRRRRRVAQLLDPAGRAAGRRAALRSRRGFSGRPSSSRCSSSTARTFSSTLSLRKIEASCGR